MLNSGTHYKYVGDLGDQPVFAEFDVPSESILTMKKNFDKMRRLSNDDLPPVNIDHSNKREGDIVDLFVTKGKFADQEVTQLRGRVQITDPQTAQDFASGKYAFASVEFFQHYPDENGEDQGPTLVGVALTNYPVAKGLERPVVFSYEAMKEHKGEKKVSNQDLGQAVKAVLSELGLGSVEDLKQKFSQAVEEKANMEAKLAEMSQKLEKLEKEKVEFAAKAAVEPLINKRILEKDRSKYEELYKRDPEMFAQIVETLPEIEVTKRVSHSGENQEDDEEVKISKMSTWEKKVYFASKIDEYMKAHNWQGPAQYSMAYSIVAQQYPELAKLERRG
ncbi:MAG: hypothetical protein D6816_15370 [Bacteroidetes bacterium]|nr:MAG: hypothetical protein D6816_15370 [Bacteroidota bacterium]